MKISNVIAAVAVLASVSLPAIAGDADCSKASVAQPETIGQVPVPSTPGVLPVVPTDSETTIIKKEVVPVPVPVVPVTPAPDKEVKSETTTEKKVEKKEEVQH